MSVIPAAVTVLAILILVGVIGAIVAAIKFLISTGFIYLVVWIALIIGAIVGIGALLHVGWNML